MILELEFNKDLLWCSDWMGDEIGYEHIESVIGLYRLANTDIHFYIDMEELKIIEAFELREDE